MGQQTPFQDPDFRKQDPSQASRTRVLSSDDLFLGHREIVIQHGDARYRLQITKAGKLILNK